MQMCLSESSGTHQGVAKGQWWTMIPKQSRAERKLANTSATGMLRSLEIKRAQRSRRGGTRQHAAVERKIFAAIAAIGLRRAREIINDVAVNGSAG